MQEASIKWVIVLFQFFALFGCDSCLHSLYGVHEEPEHIRKFFAADKNVVDRFRRYVDSANAVYRASPSSAISLLTLSGNERTLCLNNAGSECYLLEFPAGGGIVVEGVFSARISKNSWLLFRNQISDAELETLSRHFEEQVLTKFR